MLVRAGVGHLTLVDSDKVSESNINRQLPALHSTVGRPKTEVLSERLMDINPLLDLQVIDDFICEENIPQLLGGRSFDCVADAIDTLSPKIALIQFCLSRGLPLVSSMGSGAKLDATAVRIADISKTRMCPLAHQLRKRLHRFGITEGFLAVYSEEKPIAGAMIPEEGRNKRSNVGTVSYLPAVFGCVCAQAVIGILTGSCTSPR
ncbi:MAG: tRNA threonylcarbamoyladenosine dehydratase, partial [Bacteroidales bacterium]|nr:tRNA threonylcarbamoyladenosine dehydratase [Bacteroidales bacterium]